MEVRKRDREQREIAEKHNKKKKRDKSLVEIHQEKLKTKKVLFGKIGCERRVHRVDFGFRRRPVRSSVVRLAGISICRLIGSMRHRRRPL